MTGDSTFPNAPESRDFATQNNAQRLPLTALLASLIALGTLYITTRNWVLAPVALVLIGSLFSKFRVDGNSGFVRTGRYAVFGFLLWQSYDYVTSPTADSQEMVFAYTVGYLCAVEMAIQAWIRRPASGARSPATILLSAMVFLAASNTLNQDYIRYCTPLYFLFLSLSWRAFSPSLHHSRTFWKRGALLAVVLGLSSLVHGLVWHYRQEISSWGMKFLEGRSMESTGLSTDPYLSSSFNVRGATNRILRIENPPIDGDALYLRVAAFADYSQNRWLPQISREPGLIITPRSLKASRNSKPLQRDAMRVTRIMDDQDLVFAPLYSAGFTFPLDTRLQWTPPLEPLQAAANDGSRGLIYEVQFSEKSQFQGVFCKPPNQAWLARYTKVPNDIDPRVKELAHSISAQAKNDGERVRAIAQHLMQNHAYSLQSQFGSGDRTSQFLLSKKASHCEYFASGGAILLRCLGIPCRYVIGYMAHEPDGDNALVVRGRDAHAWLECWIDNKWVTADFTPGGGRPEGRAESLPLKVKLTEFFQRVSEYLRAQLDRLRAMPLRNWLILFAGMLLFLLWRARGPRRQKIVQNHFAYASRDAALEQLSERFDKWLHHQNAPCPPGLTWTQHLQRIGLPDALPFATHYDAARFGRDKALLELQNLLDELEKSHEPKH